MRIAKTLIISFILSFFLLACGPKVKLSQNFEENNFKTFALLPLSAPPEVRPERVLILREAIKNSIKDKGYSLIEDEVLEQFCQDALCSKKSDLFEKYNVDAFFLVDIKSVSRSNFGVGFYNGISAEISLLDSKGKKLFVVEHTESERGGLLFNSGQVFQAIKEQIDNKEDQAFRKLAYNYSTEALKALPNLNTTIDAVSPVDVAPTVVSSFVDRTIRADIKELCVVGSSGGLASLVSGNKRTNLREVSKGRYCGIYRASNLKNALEVELKSVYGNLARLAVNLSKKS